MKTYLILFCLFISYQNLASQLIATIQDPDGWTNVRKAPDGQSEIIHVIQENELFLYNCRNGYFSHRPSEEDSSTEESEWVAVCIPKNDFCLATGAGQFPIILDGYIHRSRLLPLEQMEEYHGDDFSFQFQVSEFDPTNRIIDIADDKFVVSIDGRFFWGTDGEMPRTQVDAIQVKLGGKDIPVHRVFFSDIFEFRRDFSVYKNGNTFFVYQVNSDGAGGYELVWGFDSNGL